MSFFFLVEISEVCAVDQGFAILYGQIIFLKLVNFCKAFKGFSMSLHSLIFKVKTTYLPLYILDISNFYENYQWFKCILSWIDSISLYTVQIMLSFIL